MLLRWVPGIVSLITGLFSGTPPQLRDNGPSRIFDSFKIVSLPLDKYDAEVYVQAGRCRWINVPDFHIVWVMQYLFFSPVRLHCTCVLLEIWFKFQWLGLIILYDCLRVSDYPKVKYSHSPVISRWNCLIYRTSNKQRNFLDSVEPRLMTTSELRPPSDIRPPASFTPIWALLRRSFCNAVQISAMGFYIHLNLRNNTMHLPFKTAFEPQK